MKFSQLIESVKINLPITPRHEAWLSKGNATYSPEALEFAQKVLSNDVGGSRRRGTAYRGSGMGQCNRKLQLRTTKVKKRNPETSLMNIFNTGHFMHLKWQMAGITEGWLIKAEIPYENKELDFGGTADGIIYDGSLFEYKTINPRGFKDVSEYGPKKEHILQAHSYMYLGELTATSFVYEDKGSGEWKEFRVERDESTIEHIEEHLRTMNKQRELKILPDPLTKCIDKEGPYRQCEFKDVCLKIQEWPA